MFDLSLAQISHPNRERDLTAALDRQRLLTESATTQAAEPSRPRRREPRRMASRISTVGR
jgi:hypothetical protein